MVITKEKLVELKETITKEFDNIEAETTRLRTELSNLDRRQHELRGGYAAFTSLIAAFDMPELPTDDVKSSCVEDYGRCVSEQITA